MFDVLMWFLLFILNILVIMVWMCFELFFVILVFRNLLISVLVVFNFGLKFIVLLIVSFIMWVL